MRRQHPRVGVLDRHVLGEVLQRDRPAALDPARRPAASVPGDQAEHRALAGAVDPDDADPVARAEPPGGVRAAAARSPRVRSTSSRSTTSLPSRWVANLCSSIRSRGGGTSSISALAASMRNFGFEVRAGGPRRSQASSLRVRFCRRDSEAEACRCRSALASTKAAYPPS